MSVVWIEPKRRVRPKAKWEGTLKKRRRTIELRREVYGTCVLVVVSGHRTGGYSGITGYGGQSRSATAKWVLRTTLSMNGKLIIDYPAAFLTELVEVIEMAKEKVRAWNPDLYQEVLP